MKKLLLTLLGSILLTTAYAQINLGKLKKKAIPMTQTEQGDPVNGVEEDLNKAKAYLKDDTCNYQGIAWAQAVLKRDPNNEEAKGLINSCNKYKYNRAVETLKTEPDNDKSMKDLEGLIDQEEFNTEEANYLLALGNLYERTPNQYVENYINKAISLNENNLNYRWIRVRCNLLSSSKQDDFSQAIEDLNFMITNGAATAKVYNNLGVANKELADILANFVKAKRTNSYSDDNSAYIEAQTAIYNDAINYYKAAIEAKTKAIELGYEAQASNLEYDIDDLKLDISHVEKSIKELKDR